jgi:glycosyltransferase involved in cell wall biosynthesis
MPRVSVVMPYYNTPIPLTETALGSVLRQTVSDWEAIVVNDGSRDEMTRALEAMLARLDDRRIRYLSGPNQGASAARNRGAAAATGEFLGLLDSDDLWQPLRLERGLQCIDVDPTITLVHTDCDVLDSGGKMKPRRTQGNPELAGPSGTGLFRRVLQQNCIATSSVLVRRTSFLDARGFDETLERMEDKDLWLRLLLGGHRIHYLDEPLVIYRDTAGSLSKNVPKMYRDRLQLVDKLDRMMEHQSLITRAEWQQVRRQYLDEARWQRAWGYLLARSYGQALWYSGPTYLGTSAASLRQMSRVLWRALLPR